MAHILIVDDSPFARNVVKRCLSLAGSTLPVVEAGDGVQALGAIQRETPTLVICDLVMPRMDGRTLLKRLKAHPRYSKVPFVIVSSLINDAEREALEQEGANQVLGKPVRPAQLSDVLSRHLMTHGGAH